MLNANRTYYLTRSQPPLLSEMVLAVYRATDDRAWLAGARDALDATYEHWTTPPHLIPAHRPVALLRSRRRARRPRWSPASATPQGRNHYDRVRAWFRAHPDDAPSAVTTTAKPTS